jgi:bleomycin hydrolase
MFLQLVIDTAKKPMDDRKVEWLFHNPIGDGGQFTGVSDIITKYGVVPATAMPETYTTNHTSTFSKLLGWKLKEWGLELREVAAKDSKKAQSRKDEMMKEVYRMLAMNFGVPPTQFTYKGKAYTPKTFYNELFGNDLKNNYVMFMNDPTRPFYKLYEIDLDRHTYDGANWKYINVPIEEIKKMAIESIKDSTAMYFSCDVNKYINRDNGTLNLDNYDYASIMGVDFGMTKAQRIATGASGSTHAMTLVGVDLDSDGNSTKWLIENSWGKSANEGHLIATDKWMDEYLFRLVVERRFVPQNLLDILSQKATVLPCWDPMY